MPPRLPTVYHFGSLHSGTNSGIRLQVTACPVKFTLLVLCPSLHQILATPLPESILSAVFSTSLSTRETENDGCQPDGCASFDTSRGQSTITLTLNIPQLIHQHSCLPPPKLPYVLLDYLSDFSTHHLRQRKGMVCFLLASVFFV